MQRAWYRNVLMYGFNFLVVVLSGVHGISDTQCGFKLFTRRASRSIFSSLHLERWAFDVEVLYIASRLGWKRCAESGWRRFYRLMAVWCTGRGNCELSLG